MATEDKEIRNLGMACRRKPGENREVWRQRRKRLTDKHFKHHRGVPFGRNFAFWDHEETEENRENYRNNFDQIFPNAPGVGL